MSVPGDFIWPHAHLKITIPYVAQNIKWGKNHEVQSTGLDFPIPGKLTAAPGENSELNLQSFQMSTFFCD